MLWVLCEIAICACDLAEVIGSAIALNLLFGIPLVWGVCITALDVLVVMYLQNKGFRYIEALVITLILTIGGCFLRGDHLLAARSAAACWAASCRRARSSRTRTCSTSPSASSARR